MKTKTELKAKRILKKTTRNENKRSVTTKSFNDKTNDFVPKVEQLRNPDAVLYLRLKNSGKLPLKKGEVITYKDWISGKFDKIRKAI